MWQKLGIISGLRDGQRIKVGLVTHGEFKKGKATVVAATSAEQILLVEYPSGLIGSATVDVNRNDHVVLLNGNIPITSVHCARFPNRDTDILLFANRNHLKAFDVQANCDVFTSSIPDGGNVVLTGRISAEPEMLTIVGGNCSVQGFDHEGTEKLWLVTGDNVRSLALVDNQLLVGSDDYDIRIFHGEDLIAEITETHVVTHLTTLENQLFAYALANGTVGVYEKRQRLWRVKSKHRATCLTYAIWQQGNESVLITGWQGGKVDVRNIRTGEVLIKDHMDDTVAGIVHLSLERMLLAVSITGQVIAFNLKATTTNTKYTRSQNLREIMRELVARRQDLMLELSNYKMSTNSNRSNPMMALDAGVSNGIPARTRLQTCLAVVREGDGEGENSSAKPHVKIMLSTNNETIIRTVLVFAEGMFKGETQVKHPHPNVVDTNLSVSLYPPTDVPIDIHIKALVGNSSNDEQYHVFEVTRQLPRFSMYAYIEKPSATVEASGQVQFQIRDRVQRILLWMDKNFLLEPPPSQAMTVDGKSSTELDIVVVCLRDGSEVGLSMDVNNVISIRTDNMALAGDLVQSLAEYLNLEQLQSTANFPHEEAVCRELLETMQQLDEAKRKLLMELGDRGALVRSLVVRGEDARLLGDYSLQRRFLHELRLLGRELRQRHEIRAAQYNDSVNVAKQVKLLVQRGLRLRVMQSSGSSDPFSLSVVRKALSDYDPVPIINLIRTGHA